MSELDQQLAQARRDIITAERALNVAQMARDEAREMAGGLLSFGGSGPQGAATKVRNATDRAMTLHAQASANLLKAQRRERSIVARIAERDRVKFTHDDLAGAKFIRTRHGWWDVVRVNAKSVTVATNFSWTERVPFDDVLEVKP